MTCGREIGYTCSDNPTLSSPGCGEHFGSLEAFDRHLRGDERQCMTTRMMLARGFRRKDNGSWSVDRPLGSPEQTSLRLRQGRPRKPEKKRRVRRSAARTRSPGRGTSALLLGESEARDPT